MSRIWRWITPVAVAGGLIAGVPAIPAATASTAATSIISINATSPHYPGLRAKDHGLVDGFAIVIYHDTKNSANTGTVSGKVTTAAMNDTAALLAKPFGAPNFTQVAGQSLTPSGGTATYSFNVKPSLATQYKVQVTGTDSAVSVVKTVYVTEGGGITGGSAHCTHTSCRFSLRLSVQLPSSALRHEIGKHWYEYLAVGFPRLPKEASLSKAATVSKAKKIKGGYERTFTYSFRLRRGTPNPDPIECVKDTESTDGLGLPGHHGCGAKRVSSNPIYLG
jgi:hypothetical protein